MTIPSKSPTQVGSTNLANPKNFRRYWNILTDNEYHSKSEAKIVVNACAELSAQNIGALIVFERNTSLDIFKESGDKVNMDISTPVIESIFFKGGPLHDGAIVIDGNRIVATRVALPISEQSDIPVRYGLRHRAAVGVSEKTDASVIVVSEETGKISYIKNGEFISFSSNDNLIEIIEEDLS